MPTVFITMASATMRRLMSIDPPLLHKVRSSLRLAKLRPYGAQGSQEPDEQPPHANQAI
eukprot:CAMPEP_0197057348 /NCGR_PEP_ID=MMETSP1384-20130603/96142_1 /TAXON_ID=29189 /ORGANISM="Ammonia sp." /LENGTH=58 /DNA_ID=CAMNT_0042491739 /DNA_START=64 /DNA_END=240 /DNA_ORIENTATION=+